MLADRLSMNHMLLMFMIGELNNLDARELLEAVGDFSQEPHTPRLTVCAYL